MNSNLRTGDTVVVIAGKDKGKTGKIVKSDAHKGRVTVAGVNIVSKHRKARSQTDKGGIKKEEAPIDVSNVQIICPNCGKATRIGHLIDADGKKHRKCLKCNGVMDGEKRAKTSKPTKEADAKVKEAKAEKVTENKTERATKKVPTAKSAGVASKAKVDTSTTKRKTPQAKSTAK